MSNPLFVYYYYFFKNRLGKNVVSDRKNFIKNTTDPEFYRSFEINTELPGASQLTVSVFDYDRVTSDDLIGETVIDLEVNSRIFFFFFFL